MAQRPQTAKERKDKRDYENAYSRERGRELNEISPLPPCENLSLRRDLEASPADWLREILPDVFFADFTESQEKFIQLAWDAIVKGSWRNIEAYRGLGKTSILSGLLFKALCEGLVRHAIYVTAEGGASTQQAAYWFNNALYDDYNARGQDARLFTRLYPEISYPLQRREGRAQRPLTVEGTPLKIEVKSDRIVFPNVPGARCAGSLLRFTSISSGGLRGANHTIQGVGSFRVRAVMLDDVQNDATARSSVEVDGIISTIQKSIRGLAGRRKDGSRESLTVLSAITQNQPGDVAERLIEDIPEFGTVVIPFVKRLPDNFDAWKEYRGVREALLRKHAENMEQARKELAAYYTRRRDDLARGVIVDDERQKEAWQVDAIHYAIDYWSASEASFWCEFQNDARRAAVETGAGLAAVDVARKQRKGASGDVLRRYIVPAGADVMTAHIDAGEHYLNYEVVAFSRDFSLAHVVDFGIFPEQDVATKKSFEKDLQEVYKRGDKFDRLKDAALDCLLMIFNQSYFNERGEPFDVEQATDFEQHAHPRGRARRRFPFLAICGVDCEDPEMEASLWSAVDEFHRIDGGRFSGRAIPCYGQESRSRLMRYYDLKAGEWRRNARAGCGYDWIENAQARRAIARGYANVYASFTYDANTAKTRRDAAWKLPADRPGAATICARDSFVNPDSFAMFCAHQTAEDYVERSKSGLIYRFWSMKRPRVSDNEFLDTDAACRVLAEYVGCEVVDVAALTEKKKRRFARRFGV